MRRLSLHWRVALILGFGTLLVTSVLAIATWNLASGYMLRQREGSAVRQAEVNVRLVEKSLDSGGLDELLTGLTTGPDSSILVLRPGKLLTAGRPVDAGALPDSLLDMGRRGVSARQRIIVNDLPMIAVTMPVANAVYVELFPLEQLDRTFQYISGLLITGTIASAVLGALMGSWASKRALRPLSELNAAARRIASGDLQARLPAQGDPDLKALAEKFNSTVAELEQRVLRDSRFASDVSHELRSPLTTMVNAGEVLRRRLSLLPGPAGQALTLLTSEVDRFARMVVDLLEISRDDQTDERLCEEVDLGALVRNVVATRPQLAEVPIEVAESPVVVLADRRRLDRVLTNLLDNAERHAGGPVRLAVTRAADCVRLEVDDAGPGVPPELRERIFERFARGTRGGDSGSGLGLALVSEHVKRHGGRVWVQDRCPIGAQFVVELPCAG
ncbi:two-component sensor histidine kinase [Lentzea sp. NBRC 105346]|uniref:sensor histidine kinase n=1 Tax=Lentzea sp. NBRC 105346 TaxID=3032205 RepID=UPI0024A2A4BF|nr:HAMP domain-containing sensor histidine kinase [Lentzea sp. NBRC 105346]GLZ31664.1 two-component sensor histidine kinase [Lentzea sp. NBRC 105346]